MNKVGIDEVAVNTVEVKLTYENRMKLINMLTYAGANETASLFVRVWCGWDDKSKAEVNVDGGIGVITDAVDLAVILKGEGKAA